MYLLKEQELWSPLVYFIQEPIKFDGLLLHLKVVPGYSTTAMLKSNPVTAEMVVNLIDIPFFLKAGGRVWSFSVS